MTTGRKRLSRSRLTRDLRSITRTDALPAYLPSLAAFVEALNGEGTLNDTVSVGLLYAEGAGVAHRSSRAC